MATIIAILINFCYLSYKKETQLVYYIPNFKNYNLLLIPVYINIQFLNLTIKILIIFNDFTLYIIINLYCQA